jgi:glycosyltransferase involved in cell wall biosynthesis
MVRQTEPLTEPLRVLHVASGDLWAGAEVQLYQLAREQRKDPRTAPHVVLMNHGLLEHNLRAEGIRFTVLDETRLGSPAILRRLLQLIGRFRPHVVHTHRQKENVLGAVAARLAGVPVCLRTVHGAPEFNAPLWRADKQLYRLMDWFAGALLQDTIIAVSEPLGHELAAVYPRRKIAVIPNGIDFLETARRAAEEVELPGADTDMRLALVGRLVPVKRPDIFVQTAAQVLAATDKPVRFFIFGDGPLSSEISALITSLGLQERVHLMGFTDPLLPCLNRMHALLVTSDHEGLPMIVLEALALRVPVIARGVGGIPEVLRNGRYGRLIARQAPENYADAVLEYLQHSETQREAAEKAFEHAANYYSAMATSASYDRAYRGALASGGQHRD